jgi:hypothetical protein
MTRCDDGPSAALDECINRLHSRIELHHVAAGHLYKTHKKATHFLVFVAAALHRSISLVHGFYTLIPDNYISAAPLVRLQLDSTLRFSALSLVADPEDFAKKVSSGEQINKLKDRDGERMTDAYLVRKLNEQYPGMNQCYEDGCGYVHFSDAHLYHVCSTTDDGKFRLQIGGELGITDDNRNDAVFMMDQATRLLLVFVERHLQQKDPTILVMPPDWHRTYCST